uniref:Transmembrane protein 216 n=1 Tax=Lygus hesperus TaxID=30085 RepID=A0A0A9WUQ7_LYGHE
MPNLGLASITFFNYYYYCMFAVATAASYLYKVTSLPYPSGNVASEVAIFLFLGAIQVMRLYLARKGNLTDSWPPMLVSLLLTAPSLLGVLYFRLWQTYILRLEVILVYIELIFETLFFIFGLLHFLTLLYYKG